MNTITNQDEEVTQDQRNALLSAIRCFKGNQSDIDAALNTIISLRSLARKQEDRIAQLEASIAKIYTDAFPERSVK
jgi:hypothetical protein